MHTYPSSDVEQWLVSAYNTNSLSASQVLLQFIEFLRSRPDIQVVNIIGTEAFPRQLVIRASASVIPVLQASFSNQIVIAPDKPLQLFNNLPYSYGNFNKGGNRNG